MTRLPVRRQASSIRFSIFLSGPEGSATARDRPSEKREKKQCTDKWRLDGYSMHPVWRHASRMSTIVHGAAVGLRGHYIKGACH